MANVIIRPATYRKHKRVLDANAAVVVTGTLQTMDGVISCSRRDSTDLALFVKIRRARVAVSCIAPPPRYRSAVKPVAPSCDALQLGRRLPDTGNSR